MKNLICSFMMFTSFLTPGQTQNPIDIYESTLKIGGTKTEEYVCGFAEGDQLIFNFEEVNGKELKEIEIIAYPSASKFMDYKSSKISNKTLSIPTTGIYVFRFSNSAISGRICKFKIQRIPSSEATKNFNTNVYKRTLYDTTYTPKLEKYLIRSDTSAITIVDQVAKVSSQTAMNGSTNFTIIDFTLPEGTLSWSFYIGVGNKGEDAYQAASDMFFSNAAEAAISIPGYGTMAALALNGINYFTKVQGDDNIKYYFLRDWESVQLFKSGQPFYQYKQGDVVNDASRMIAPLFGKTYLGLINDNMIDAVEVTVKITAIVITSQWGSRTIQEMIVTPREEMYLSN